MIKLLLLLLLLQDPLLGRIERLEARVDSLHGLTAPPPVTDFVHIGDPNGDIDSGVAAILSAPRHWVLQTFRLTQNHPDAHYFSGGVPEPHREAALDLAALLLPETPRSFESLPEAAEVIVDGPLTTLHRSAHRPTRVIWLGCQYYGRLECGGDHNSRSDMGAVRWLLSDYGGEVVIVPETVAAVLTAAAEEVTLGFDPAARAEILRRAGPGVRKWWDLALVFPGLWREIAEYSATVRVVTRLDEGLWREMLREGL